MGEPIASRPRKAWLVTGFDASCVCWVESRGKARMLAARSAHEALNIPIGDALKGLSGKRSPAHDYLTGHYVPSMVIDVEYLAIDEALRG